MTEMRIERGAARVMETLEGAGFQAYAVGGCVRDALLGHKANDWDVCTSALPEETLSLFGEGNCILTGLKHGTVTVKMDGGLYEVTTFRTEGTYSDGRHPDRVDFVADVREDLARRDFTINAMAYSPKTGLVDPFGGREDLQKGVVRAVGEPVRRFSEDALRIMRLLRFSARFGFVMEEETLLAALTLRENLRRVSGERIREELMKLLGARKFAAYLPQAIARVILPECGKLEATVYAAALAAADALPADAEIRLAALLAPACAGTDTAGAQAAMKRLRCSNRTMERVTRAIAGAGEETGAQTPSLCARMRRRLGQWGEGTLEDIGMLAGALRSEEDASAIREAISAALSAKAQGRCCSMKELAITGADAAQLLGGAGPQVGKILERLLCAVLEDELKNEREALLRAALHMAGEGKEKA